MTMEIHGFTESGSIDATIENVRMTVPDDLANRHRQMIAEWEAEGNTIPPYVPPEPSTVVDEEFILREAMFDDFVERSARNSSTPKNIREAATRLKARRNKE